MGEVTQAVFLSCSSQDAAAAERLCEGLRAAGLEVWFDRNELRGGDAWDASIRRQIRDCALFIPVISANTEARGEGYFRLEWRLAVERSHLMADDQAYLFPVVIDDTDEATARVPDRFRERQWTRLPGGECPPAFIDQVKRSLAAAAAGTPAPFRPASNTLPRAPARARRTWMIGAALIGVALAALAVALVSLYRHRSLSRPAQVNAVAATAAGALDPKAIAVLPFVNLTGRAEDAYLADGLQEEILSTLARVRDLKVISRTSTTEFRGFTPNVREVGDRLGVGSVLEGSVRREGKKLRLTVQLIDTRNDRHVLAADYDRDLGHILGLQTEVAGKIADALSATLSNLERGELERVTTNSGDAYELYLRAVATGFRPVGKKDPDLDSARRLLEQALRQDPGFSDAAALLSRTCTRMNFFRDIAEQASCARKYYERALELDPQSPEARLARGLYGIYIAKDLDQAIVDLEAVVRVRPNSSTAHASLGLALRRHSRFNEALAEFTRAWDLDPLNMEPSELVESTLMGLRRYPELVDQMKLFQRRFLPSRTYGAYIGMARAQARVQHSAEPLRQALQEHGDTLDAVARTVAEAQLARMEGRYLDAAKLVLTCSVDWCNREFRLGFLYWAAGKTEESRRWFRTLERLEEADVRRDPLDPSARRDLALARSMLGEHAGALASIDAARALVPEAKDPLNGPALSFMRSIILVRAGRTAEGYAEVARLLRVPFGSPSQDPLDVAIGDVLLLVKDDRHYDEIIHNPPRL